MHYYGQPEKLSKIPNHFEWLKLFSPALELVLVYADNQIKHFCALFGAVVVSY